MGLDVSSPVSRNVTSPLPGPVTNRRGRPPGLDPINTRLVCDLVREAADRGAAVLVSAHQLSLVEQLCTDVTMLAAGRVVLAGPMASVRSTPQETLEELFVSRAAIGGE